MLKATIEVTGKTWSDLEDAVREAQKGIANENWLGFDRNEDGSYHFEVKGEDETPEEDEDA